MNDYRVWGRIEQVAPGEFFVIVSTVRDDNPYDVKSVTRLIASRSAAEETRRSLVIEVGAAVVARGDRVVDVEVD